MATTTIGRVALMSIHPTYAWSICDGSKKVEFRKRPVADDVTHVLVYATAPIKSIVCAFSVAGQVISTPEELWRRYRGVAGISRTAFFDYYRGRAAATGIQIGNVTTFSNWRCITADLGLARPPQSYQYVSLKAALPLLVCQPAAAISAATSI